MRSATGRSELQPIVAEDKVYIHRGLSHPDVVRYYAVNYPNLEAVQEQMDWYASIAREGTGQWWAIRATSHHAFCGAIGINNIVAQHRRCELGFWLLPEHWRQGIISDVLPLVIHHAFDALGLHRIMAEVETENSASARVLQRTGFKHEGTLRDCEVKDGRLISLDVFARLATDP
ncbi:MAG: GNAT family N-acetyltransferase [Flavobacteriales bacterium]|nr:GNAT family N-acetyltransferase [Flavobacteriales bacterium]